MLDSIKERLGLDAATTVYDSELESLIQAAQADMKASGVPADMVDAEEPDGRILLCVTAYVKGYYGDDRQNTSRYTQIYREQVFRLCQEEGGS